MRAPWCRDCSRWHVEGACGDFSDRSAVLRSEFALVTLGALLDARTEEEEIAMFAAEKERD